MPDTTSRKEIDVKTVTRAQLNQLMAQYVDPYHAKYNLNYTMQIVELIRILDALPVGYELGRTLGLAKECRCRVGSGNVGQAIDLCSAICFALLEYAGFTLIR